MQKRESDRPLVLAHRCVVFFFTFLTATACVGFGSWPGTCMEQVRLTSPGTVPQAGPTHGEVQKGADDPGRRPGAVRPAEAVATASPGPPARPRVLSGFCRRGPPEPSGKRSRGAPSALPRGFPARRLSLSGLAHRLSDCLLCVPELWAGVDSPPHLRVPHRQAQRCLRRAKRPAVPESDARGLPGPRAEATDSRPALKPGVGLTVTRPRDSETGGAVERGPVQWPPYRPRPGGLRSSLGDAGERRRGGRRGVT